MNKPIFNLRSAISLCTALAVAMAPTMPIFAQEVSSVGSDIDRLFERAVYPNIPRNGQTGIPSQSETDQALSQLNSMRSNLDSSIQQKLGDVLNPEAEPQLLEDLMVYFNAAKKYEALKVMMGQKPNVKDWSKTYSVKMKLADIRTIGIIGATSWSSRWFTQLSDEQEVIEVAQQIREESPFLSSLIYENKEWYLKLELNGEFLADLERFYYSQNPSKSNVVRFAMQFASERLYDSLSTTLTLLKTPSQSLPEVWNFMTEAFPSLSLKRQRIVESLKRETYEPRRNEIVKVINDQVEAYQNSGRGHLASETLTEFIPALGLDPTRITAEDWKTIESDFNQSFFATLNGLIQFFPAEKWDDYARFHLSEAARMTLSWSFSANPGIGGQLPPDQQARLNQFILTKAQTFAQEVLAATSISNDVARILSAPTNQFAEQKRKTFQERVQKLAPQIKNFAENEMSFSYLLTAQSKSIQALDPGAINLELMQALAAATNFEQAYDIYKMTLLNWIQGYSIPGLAPLKTITFAAVKDLVENATWNPKGLTEINPKFLGALSADTQARDKDLADLIEIGKLLKMDIYEALPLKVDAIDRVPYKDMSLSGFKLDDSLLYSMMGISEKRRYEDAVKNDLYLNAPILGKTIKAENGRALWEVLADVNVSKEKKFEYTEQAISGVTQAIQTSAQEVGGFLKQLQNAEADLDVSKDDLQTLISRSAQIGVSIDGIVSLSPYYRNMREANLLPGFWQNQLNKFNSWSNYVFGAMLGLIVGQVVFSKVRPIASAFYFIDDVLAPVFGRSFSGLKWFFRAIMLQMVAVPAYQWHSENQRASMLQRFFECGSGGACVALYADVTNQLERSHIERFKTASFLATWGLLHFGFMYIPKLITSSVYKMFYRLSPERIALIRNDMKNLNLSENASFSTKDLRIALDQRLAVVNAIQDPIERGLQQVLVKMSYQRLQASIWHQVRAWIKADGKFAQVARELGMSGPAWKSVTAIEQMLTRVEHLFANKQISNYQYRTYQRALLKMYRLMKPTTEAIAKDKFLSGFYQRVWSESAGRIAPEVKGVLLAVDRGYSSAAIENLESALHQVARPRVLGGRYLGQKVVEPSAKQQSQLKVLNQSLKSVLDNPNVTPGELEALSRLVQSGGRP